MTDKRKTEMLPDYMAPASESVLLDCQDLLCLSVTNEDIGQIDPYDGWDS
ncbi:MAG: hypothetical protein IKX67_00455 [Bacteroidales bacterium]|nr:hypothetical protein [Bacteroidales bacterium]